MDYSTSFLLIIAKILCHGGVKVPNKLPSFQVFKAINLKNWFETYELHNYRPDKPKNYSLILVLRTT